MFVVWAGTELRICGSLCIMSMMLNIPCLLRYYLLKSSILSYYLSIATYNMAFFLFVLDVTMILAYSVCSVAHTFTCENCIENMIWSHDFYNLQNKVCKYFSNIVHVNFL